MRVPGTVPLSDLRHYQIRPHHSPERVAARGDFYIRDAWCRPSLAQGRQGPQEVVFLIDFTAGDDDRSIVFSLEWSPLREKVAELVLRGGSPVGPCRLISKPLYDSLNIWTIVGMEDDGSIYDPLFMVPPPDRPRPDAVTL